MNSPFTQRQAGIPLSEIGGLPPLRTPAAPVEAARSAPLVQEVSPALSRILRPQAAYRWLLPYLSAITPQYIESTLRGALAGNHVQAWELFDLMMDTDPEIASCVQEFTEGVQRKKLIVEPYCEDDEPPTDSAVEKSKVVSAALRKMSPTAVNDENELTGTIRDIISARFVGTAILEADWYQDGDNADQLNMIDTPAGPILAPRCTYWVHPVCYAWDMDGKLGLRIELQNERWRTSQDKRTGNMTSPPAWNMISSQPRPSALSPFPDHKFLIAIHKAKAGTALGGPLLRPLAWWWMASNFCGDWMLNLAQLFGIPFRKATYASGIGDGTKQEILNMLQMAGSAGYIALPEGANLELVEGGNHGSQSPQAFLFEFADKQKRKLILGQTMSGSSGSTGKGGGQAFGQVEREVKADKIDAGAAFACNILNTQLVRSIIQLNYQEDTELPRCRMLEEEEGTLPDAQRDQTLASAGLKIGVNFLRKKYGIPAPADDEETIGGTAPAAPGNDQPKPGAGAGPGQQTGDGGDLEAKRVALEAAKTQPQTPEIAEVLRESLLPLLKRLEAIAQVDDAAIQQHMIEKLLKDFPQIAAAIHADDSLAKQLYPTLATAMIKGLTQNQNED